MSSFFCYTYDFKLLQMDVWSVKHCGLFFYSSLNVSIVLVLIESNNLCCGNFYLLKFQELMLF